MKIESNPFARGFRGDWRKYSENSPKKSKYSSKLKEEVCSSSPDPIRNTEENMTNPHKECKIGNVVGDTSDYEEESESCVGDKIKEEEDEAEGETSEAETMVTDHG